LFFGGADMEQCTSLDAGRRWVSGHAKTVAAPPKNKKKKRDGIVFWLETGHPYGVWGPTREAKLMQTCEKCG
jgi:hypothetical protein